MAHVRSPRRSTEAAKYVEPSTAENPEFDAQVHQYLEYLGVDESETDIVEMIRAEFIKPLPKGWEYCQDEHGDVFYYNAALKKSSWDHPADQELRAMIGLMRQQRDVANAALSSSGLFPGMSGMPGNPSASGMGAVPGVAPGAGTIPGIMSTLPGVAPGGLPGPGGLPMQPPTGFPTSGAPATGLLFPENARLEPNTLPIMPPDDLFIYTKRCLPNLQSFVQFVKRLSDAAQSSELAQYEQELKIKHAQKKADLELEVMDSERRAWRLGRDTSRSSGLENDLRTAEDRAARAESRLSDTQRKLEEYEDKLRRSDAKLRDEENNVRDAQRSASDAKSRLESAERSLRDQQNRVHELETQVQDWRKKANDADRKVQDLDERLRDAEARATAAKQRVAAAEATAAAAAADAAAAAARLGSVSPVTPISHPSTPAGGFGAAAAASQAATYAAECAELRSQINKLTDEGSQAKRRADDLQRKLNDALSEAADKASSLENLETRYKRAKDQCSELQKTRVELEERLEDMQRDTTRNKAEVERLNRRLQSQKDLIDELETKLVQAQQAEALSRHDGRSDTEAAEKISRLQEQIKTLEAELTKTKKKLEKALAEAEAAEDLRETNSKLKSKIADLEKQIKQKTREAIIASPTRASRTTRAQTVSESSESEASEAESPEVVIPSTPVSEKRRRRPPTATTTTTYSEDVGFAISEGLSDTARTLTQERKLLDKERALIGAERLALIERQKRLAARINAYRQAVRDYEADCETKRLTPEQRLERKAALRSEREKLRAAVPKYTADTRVFRRRLDEWFQRNEAFCKALGEAGHGLSLEDESDLGLGLGLDDLAEFAEFGTAPTRGGFGAGSATVPGGDGTSSTDSATKVAAELVQQLQAATEAVKVFRGVVKDVLPSQPQQQPSGSDAMAPYHRPVGAPSSSQPQSGLTPTLAASWRRYVESTTEPGNAQSGGYMDYLSPAAAAALVPPAPSLDPAAHLHSDMGLNVARANVAARVLQNTRLRQQLQAHQSGLNSMHDLLRKPLTSGLGGYTATRSSRP